MTSAPLGEFEQIVLMAVVRLDADAYGATIRREIESRTGRRLSISGVYTTSSVSKRRATCGRDRRPDGGARRPAAQALRAAAARQARPALGLHRVYRHGGRPRTPAEGTLMPAAPQRLLLWLARVTLPRGGREWMAGDLEEGHAAIVL